MKMTPVWGLAVAGCMIVAVAVGQGRPSPDQIAATYRKALMTVIAGNQTPLALMGRDRAPYDAALIAKNTERTAQLSAMVADAFARDTSAAPIEGNEASPNIWKQKADFDKLADDVRAKADAVLAAVKGGDQAKTKAAINDLGTSCTACHDKYRVER